MRNHICVRIKSEQNEKNPLCVAIAILIMLLMFKASGIISKNPIITSCIVPVSHSIGVIITGQELHFCELLNLAPASLRMQALLYVPST